MSPSAPPPPDDSARPHTGAGAAAATPPGSGSSDVTAYGDTNPTIPMGHVPAPGGRHGQLLGPGELLAERFRIVQFLGRGGMGEVYEAEDLELGERVALKTIRPELADDDRVLERFKREIHLARQVTHPNVCRLYDLFRHRAPSSPGRLPDLTGRRAPGELTFLTMELLGGETLAARIHRDGPLPPALALSVAEQMAAALDAAHRAGVLHRDFKSANVQLLPPRTGEGAPRVVVTDFGLARTAAEDGEDGAHLTMLEEMVGTPAYMAPEQVEGLRLGPAADIYALGVVLFELVTGKLPFVAGTALSTAIKRLSEPPPSPRSLRPDLDARWEAAVLRCLARQPGDRFASAGAVVAALRGDDRPLPAAGSQRRQLAIWVVLLLTLGVGTGWLLHRQEGGGGSGTGAARPAVRHALAVLAFNNLSRRDDVSWLSTALVEMIRTELTAGSALRAIPGENVSRMERDLGLASGATLAADTLGRVRAVIGADLLLLGSYWTQGPPGSARIQLNLLLQDARDGSVTEMKVAGSEADLLGLVAAAGAELRAKLDLAVSPEAADSRSRLLAVLPANPEAARAYAEGLDALRKAENGRARELLERAAAAAPESPLVAAALAAAWTELGYDSRALDAAHRAFDLAKSLPEEQRLLVEGRFRTAAKEWPRAVEVYRRLVDLYPDDLEYGLALTEALGRNGAAQEALDELVALRKLPAPQCDDPRIDLAEARAAEALSDYPREHRAAAAALAKGERIGARQIVAAARLADGAAAAAEGNPSGAAETYELAKADLTAAGDRRGEARVLNLLGNLAWSQGDTERARGLWEQALATYQAIGDRGAAARNLGNLAMVRDTGGDLSGALQLWEQAIREMREVGDRNGVAKSLGNVAIIYRNLGRLDEAEATQRQALEIKRALGDRRSMAFTLHNLGILLLQRGRMSEAEASFAEALELRRAIGERENVGWTLVSLASLRRERGDLPGARQALDEAEQAVGTISPPVLQKVGVDRAELAYLAGDLTGARAALDVAIREAADRKVEAADYELMAADIDIDGGDLAGAEARIARALAAATAAESPDREAQAQSALATVLAHRKDLAAAHKALAAATAAAGRSASVKLPLMVALSAAEVALASGSAGELASTRALLVEQEKVAAQLGLVTTGYDLELARLRLERAAGRSEAVAELRRLAAEATGKGLLLLARKADAAAKGP